MVARSRLAEQLATRPLALARPLDLTHCVLQLPLDLDGPCDYCGLRHSAHQGASVDLLAHHMKNQEHYAYR